MILYKLGTVLDFQIDTPNHFLVRNQFPQLNETTIFKREIRGISL